MHSPADGIHEDIPRIAVETIADWKRIKASYSQAAIRQLDEQLEANGLMHERETHLAHLNEVELILSRRSEQFKHYFIVLTPDL
jgi:hypothetical protein